MKMKLLLLIMLVFASDENKNALGNNTESRKRNETEQSVVVKIEEDEYANKGENFIGVIYNEKQTTWRAYRWSKNEKKLIYNGTHYKDKETAAYASDNLARELIANGEKDHKINFPNDDTEVFPEKITSNYIGVSYDQRDSRWRSVRWSKNECKTVNNGYYNDEETAAHASDTLARKLITNGEKGHKLNFSYDDTEVYPEYPQKSSNYIGVRYYKKQERWGAARHSKYESKVISNGSYKNEETAAHASDTLARKFIGNGEKGHNLNFPDDDTEVWEEKVSDHIGVGYNQKYATWRARRWSKNEKKMVSNGAFYKDEESAAHASDTLARKLIANGEKGHKLNFSDNDNELRSEEVTYQKKKRKRPENLGNHQDNKTYEN